MYVHVLTFWYAGFTFITEEMFSLIIAITAIIFVWTIFFKYFPWSIRAVKLSPVTKRCGNIISLVLKVFRFLWNTVRSKIPEPLRRG